ncbi:MerR family transcriptional regulator [Carnobacterium gallinarum]|uniref:MerR family transcriptional regulator n=1 Tax=Carnobacterium gallinarum TaxID=2749 RepID=UPI00054D17C4|nr:MerR family transcriptional regulator [Carnobacterium gallinarum]
MTYSIGEFSKLVGVKEHTLRFYEKEGLIQVSRNKNNIRMYNDLDVGWIEFLLHMKGTGMSLADLKKYTILRAIGDSTIYERMMLLKNQKKEVESELEKFLFNLEVLTKKIEFYEDRLEGKEYSFRLPTKK